jgi:hypothetical protein
MTSEGNISHEWPFKPGDHERKKLLKLQLLDENTRVYGNKTFEYEFFVLQNHSINQNIVLVGHSVLIGYFFEYVTNLFSNVLSTRPGLLIIRK